MTEHQIHGEDGTEEPHFRSTTAHFWADGPHQGERAFVEVEPYDANEISLVVNDGDHEAVSLIVTGHGAVTMGAALLFHGATSIAEADDEMVALLNAVGNRARELKERTR